MHEMSLAESMIVMIEEAADREAFDRVRLIRLEVGSLACVEQEALRFCVDAVARGTVAENARVEIVETPATGNCPDCGSSHPVTELLAPCPVCGGYAVRVSGGTGMRVKELEVV